MEGHPVDYCKERVNDFVGTVTAPLDACQQLINYCCPGHRCIQFPHPHTADFNVNEYRQFSQGVQVKL